MDIVEAMKEAWERDRERITTDMPPSLLDVIRTAYLVGYTQGAMDQINGKLKEEIKDE